MSILQKIETETGFLTFERIGIDNIFMVVYDNEKGRLCGVTLRDNEANQIRKSLFHLLT